MRADDLNHSELLQLIPDSGVIRFAGQRALLFDEVAMGILRKYLVENLGLAAARTILTQFGFAQGWRLAGVMQAQFKWDSDEEWRKAVTQLCSLKGLFRAELGSKEPISKEGLMVTASFEADQSILEFGCSPSPVCWTICGLMSGYLSRCRGIETYVEEDRCVGRGDGCCHLLGRTRAEWGDAHAEELRFFEPIGLKESLDISLQEVTERLKTIESKIRERQSAPTQAAAEVSKPLDLVANSTAMERVVDLARRIAKVDSTVLITGESGVGKERIGRLVHEESPRATGPFIAVNCGAITETLLESELFGHKRGAFTGASQDRPGLFEAANGGTLLLDEVGEVSPGMQVKLLRALQEREVRRVGENISRRVDVRVIAATNRDLAHYVAEGSFRKDLYYRLKVIELHVPSLRERRNDILPLARILLADAAKRMNRNVSALMPATADRLLNYSWPGNVRELENAMERAVALARGDRVEIEDLPEEVRQAISPPTSAPGVPLGTRPLEDVEKEHILAALELNGGNQLHTAKQLRIGSATLYRKLKSWGIIANKGPAPH